MGTEELLTRRGKRVNNQEFTQDELKLLKLLRSDRLALIFMVDAVYEKLPEFMKEESKAESVHYLMATVKFLRECHDGLESDRRINSPDPNHRGAVEKGLVEAIYSYLPTEYKDDINKSKAILTYLESITKGDSK